MPKAKAKSSFTLPSALESRIKSVVARLTRDIAEAIRTDLASSVTRLLGGSEGIRQRGQRVVTERKTILCPVPGCGKPGGGPKYGWFCGDHRNLPEAEKRRYQAERQARTVAASKPKSPRAITRSCPYPGCPNPSKGPRFSWFCAIHRELPKDERDKFLAASRATGGEAVAAPAPAAKPAKKAASGKAKKAPKPKPARAKAKPVKPSRKGSGEQKQDETKS